MWVEEVEKEREGGSPHTTQVSGTYIILPIRNVNTHRTILCVC